MCARGVLPEDDPTRAVSPPRVTVVVPAHNAEACIRQTLESVRRQTMQDYEVLVIDDCSTDATPEIVAAFAAADSRFSLVRLPANMGAPAGPRNIGIRRARGRWIALLDADDLWHPRKLELQLAAIARTGARFCSTQIVNFSDDADVPLSDAGAERLIWVTFMDQLLKLRTPLSSVVAERSVFLAHPFDERPSFKAREDLDCWLHIHEDIGRSVKLGAVLVGYRLVPGQISGSKLKMFRGHLHVLTQYKLKSGRSLRPVAWLFTLTHFGSALYFRYVRKGI